MGLKRDKIMEVIDKNTQPGVFGNGNHFVYTYEDYLKMVFGLAKENERSVSTLYPVHHLLRLSSHSP